MQTLPKAVDIRPKNSNDATSFTSILF